eukprot:g7926.t1
MCNGVRSGRALQVEKHWVLMCNGPALLDYHEHCSRGAAADGNTDQHYLTIMNIVIAVLLLMGLNTFLHDVDLFHAEGPRIFDLTLLRWSFNDLEGAAAVWLKMNLGTVLILPIAHLMTCCRHSKWVYVWGAVYILLQLAYFHISVRESLDKNIACAIMLMTEQSRLSMKMHSYIREKLLWDDAFCGANVRGPPGLQRRACKDGQVPLNSPKKPFRGNKVSPRKRRRSGVHHEKKKVEEKEKEKEEEEEEKEEQSIIVPTGSGFAEAADVTIEYWVQQIGMFFYFLWVPTLIYRENYPRTARIRWWFVLELLVYLLGVNYYLFNIFRSLAPEFKKTATQPGSLRTFVESVFESMAPAMLLLFLGHFMILHTVQNLGAELTRFADRNFYDDWWNVGSWVAYYRKWNGVVHDWIHCYIYFDFMHFLHWGKTTSTLAAGSKPLRLSQGCQPKKKKEKGLVAALYRRDGHFLHWGKTTSTLAAFGISALIHEYIIFGSVGFFYPVLFVLFGGPGVIFTMITGQAKGRFWNIFLWLMMMLGTSLILVLYGREWYWRRMPQEDLLVSPDALPPDSWLHYAPKSWLPLLVTWYGYPLP